MIPFNNPCNYAQNYRTIEHAQGELKRLLEKEYFNIQSFGNSNEVWTLLLTSLIILPEVPRWSYLLQKILQESFRQLLKKIMKGGVFMDL